MTVYFGSAALLWAVDSPHLAIVMVHLNVLESVLALKIKALNDSVAKAVQQLQSTQLQFALLVRLPACICACDGNNDSFPHVHILNSGCQWAMRRTAICLAMCPGMAGMLT